MPAKRQPSGLPIESIIPDLTQALRDRGCAVLCAEPGAGKTTVVPLALLEAGLIPSTQKIVMLQPRRVAARAAAERLSSQIGETVGQLVGYRMSLESRVSQATRIEVLTEGVLTRQLQSDPELGSVGLIIFDEFHERSLQADLGLALALEIRDNLRPDLKILVMSATIDTEGVAELIGATATGPAPIIHCQGRTHPVSVEWANQAGANGQAADFWRDPRDFLNFLAQSVKRSIRERDGDILVFLPGIGEIKRCAANLAELDADILPLHGSMTIREQSQALSPSARRKVILASSIAETSLTIDGITTVIDSGLTRLNRFDARLGMDRLTTERCSLAASLQRQGRAGRTQAGHCLKLWPQSENLRPFLEAESRRADLSAFVLDAAAWGTTQAQGLRLLSPPDPELWRQALELLTDLGAIADNRISSRGQAMLSLAMHPRLAAMNVGLTNPAQAHLAAAIAAALSQKDLLSSADSANFGLRLGSLFNSADPLAERGREMYRRWTAKLPNFKPADFAQAGSLLVSAFPDRIGALRSTNAWQKGDLQALYQLSNGRQAVLRGVDAEHAPEFLVAIDADAGDQSARIYQFAPLSAADMDAPAIADRLQTNTEISWDGWKIRPKERLCLGKLCLREKLLPLSALKPAAVSAALDRRLRQEGLQCLPWESDSQAQLSRLRWVSRRLREYAQQTGKPWPQTPGETPSWDEPFLIEQAGEWLLPYLNLSGGPVITPSQLAQAIDNLAPWDFRSFLDREAPTHLTVPSGSHRPIAYSETEPPRLSVRIQEIFGLAHQPTILGIGLTLELLSPANRPLQVTSDLDSFWDNTWPQVRKEMRGRYPKHFWPEDPRQAQATARAKPRGT